MKKLLFGLLGLLFTIPSWGACNLFNMDWLLNADGWTKNGDVYSGPADTMWSTYASGGRHFPLTFATNTQYTFSGHVGANPANARFSIVYTDGTSYMLSFGVDGDFSYTSSAGKTISRVNFGNSASGNIQLSNIQVEEGTTATAYTPYDATCIERCKNLFDSTGVTDNHFISSDGTFSAYEGFGYTQPIPAEQNTSYTLSGINGYGGSTRRVHAYNNNGEWIAQIASINLENESEPYSVTGITPTNTAYIRVSYAISDTNVQLEQGDTATAYVPYVAACHKIQVASTKYVETQFSDLGTRLANAVATVNTVVTNTINQAASIATLQSGKQTRPANDTCPAYKQCLLVEDENGTPHWYQITDPFRDFVAPIIANNVAPASTTNQPGYTQLEYIESTGTQYIDTGIIATNWDWSVEFEMSVPQAGDMFFGAGSGIWSSTNWGAQFGLANSSGNANWGAGSGGMDVVISVLGVRTNTFYNYKITKEGLYVNGELKSQNTATESFSNSDLSLWICKTNNTGGSGYIYNKSASSWKYVRIYNANNALVFNGVPAKRNSDGAIGMYDTVTKTFFTNAGTGTFTAGPTVANTDVPANGTWTATWAANATTGVSAGTVYGEGLCNATEDSTAGKIATDAQMSSANWNTTGSHCWCKIDSIDIEGSDVNTTTNKWVWITSTSGCLRDCSYYCANSTKTASGFRNIMLNTAQ